MRRSIRRRGAMAAAAALLGAGGLALSAGSASAQVVTLDTPVFGAGSGVWNAPNRTGQQVALSVQHNDRVTVDCWTRGENLGSGNVWYHTIVEQYTVLGTTLHVAGYTYGAGIDSNSAFHRGDIGEC